MFYPVDVAALALARQKYFLVADKNQLHSAIAPQLELRIKNRRLQVRKSMNFHIPSLCVVLRGLKLQSAGILGSTGRSPRYLPVFLTCKRLVAGIQAICASYITTRVTPASMSKQRARHIPRIMNRLSGGLGDSLSIDPQPLFFDWPTPCDVPEMLGFAGGVGSVLEGVCGS
jgi:hypothetical protein